MEFRTVIISSLMSFLASCASVPQELNPKVYYKNDMNLEINGLPYVGAAVVPRAASYVIKIESKADMDMLTITSCHRDEAFASVIKNNWWKARRGYTYYYTPNLKEQENGCQLRLGGYEKVNGRHSWAYVDFENPVETLPGLVSCNGNPAYLANGTSVCQSREGLLQLIQFDVPVEMSQKIDPKCKIVSADKKTWSFKQPNRECDMVFQSIDDGRMHRLKTIGYEAIAIRGE